MTLKSKVLLFVATALAAALLLTAATWAIWARGYSCVMKDVSYHEASKEFIVKIFIPPEARNITAWVQPYKMNMVASFRICEEDFVAWAKKKEWELQEAEGSELNNVSNAGDPNGSVEIKDGLLYQWVYDIEDPGSTRKIYAYDRTDGTGYFTQIGD